MLKDKEISNNDVLEFIIYVLKNMHYPYHALLLTSMNNREQSLLSLEKKEIEERFDRIIASTLHAIT